MTMIRMMITRLWWFAWGFLAVSRGCEGWLTVSNYRRTETSLRSSSSSAPNIRRSHRSADRRSFLPLPNIGLQGRLTSTAASAAKIFHDPSTVSQTDLDKLALALRSRSSSGVNVSTNNSTKNNKNASADASTTTTHIINNLQAIEELAPLTANSSTNTNVLDGTTTIPLDGAVGPETAAPPLSFQKFLTMQEKRAVVQIRYSSDAGFKPYFLTVAKKLKASHPDIIIERRILPKTPDSSSSDHEPTFEVCVDGKVVVGGKGRSRSKNRAQSALDLLKGRSIFVSMHELDLAIGRARRKSRPATTVYGDTVAATTTTATTTTTSSSKTSTTQTKTSVDKKWM